MACGQKELVWVTWWTVCWKWIFPYPCKKGGFQERYVYDFDIVRSEWALFRTKYKGCCGNRQFEWTSGFCLFCRGNWDLGPARFTFKSELNSVGVCEIDNIPDWNGPVYLKPGEGPESYFDGSFIRPK